MVGFLICIEVLSQKGLSLIDIQCETSQRRLQDFELIRWLDFLLTEMGEVVGKTDWEGIRSKLV